MSALNTTRHIDVRFTPTTGQTLNLASILDNESEILITGTAAGQVVVNGRPTQLDEETFRYTVEGEFTPGSFTISFLENLMVDSAGAGLTGRSEVITLRNLTAGLSYPAHQANVGMNRFNADRYIDVAFDDVFGVGLKAESLKDADAEIELFKYSEDEDAEEIPSSEFGIGVDGKAVHIEGNIWRFYFSGNFDPGQVYMRIVADSYEDNAGNKPLEKVETFNVYSNAFSFQIIVSGAAELYGAVESVKLVSVKGEAKLSLNTGGDGPSRVQLDLNGRADVMYFGTVGAVSGRFIFEVDFKDADKSGFWGVMKIDTNFEKLRPAGIDVDFFALLQFNFSNQTRTETLTLPGQAEGGGDLTETYVLPPLYFGLQAAGKMVLHVPDFNEDDQFGLELGRLSGVFSIEISPAGLEVLVQGRASLGPPNIPLFSDGDAADEGSSELTKLSVVGVLAIRPNGFAADLIIEAQAGFNEYVAFEGDFRFVTNVFGDDQEVRIPHRFIDGGYLPADFIRDLKPTKDPSDDPEELAYVVPGGAPKWGGGQGPTGPYLVMQGQAELYIVDVFVVEGSFRIEVSTEGLFIQADGGLLLKEVGSVNARGYLELTREGLVVAMSLDLDASSLSVIGIDFDVNAELVLNTTDEDRTIYPLSDNLLLEEITVQAGDFDIKAEGKLAFRIPGTDIEFARISGVFSLDTETERTTIFAAGELQIGPSGLDVFNMTVLGVFALVDEGFATDLVVTASGGIPSVAELEGTFRLVSNMTRIRQEVPVPQRFIDGGFLSDDFIARLSPSSTNPNRKSYYVPAGAPYPDSNNEDSPSSYIVMMGSGALTLIDQFRIPGKFRIKIETNGPVIPIDAHIDLGPLGWATVFGRAELRLSGLTAGLSVEMDAPLLRDAGLDFDADAEIGVNTSNTEVTIASEKNPNAQPIVIPPKTSFFRFGGLMNVRIPGTQTKLFGMRGAFLMEIGAGGLGMFATAEVIVDAAANLIEAQGTGAFFVTTEGVAADIDLSITSDSDVFSDVFNFQAQSRLAFNTLGKQVGIAIPDRFMPYLSERAKARLTSLGPGLPRNYYSVPAGAPLLGGQFGPAGPYFLFRMEGSASVVSVFEMTGEFQMVFTSGTFQVKFDAQMSLDPLGQLDASGILTVTSDGVYGALQLGGRLELGPLEMFGAMQLEINSFSNPVTIERVQYDFDRRQVSTGKVPVVLPPKSQRVFIGGIMVIPGFELRGTFEMINNPNVFSVSVNAYFNAFDMLILDVNGTVSIVKGSKPGLVINTYASLRAGFFGIDDVFEMDTNFLMKVNTRTGTGQDSYDRGVPRGYTRIEVNGKIKLLTLLDVEAGGFIESYAGVQRVQIYGGIEVLGQSINGSGYFSSEGEFDLQFGGGITIGAAGFGVGGSTSFRISRLDNNGTEAFGDGNYVVNVSGMVEGSVKLFGFSLASASITFGLDGSTGRVYITPTIKINLLFFDIEVSHTFTLFYVKIPRPVYLAGNASDTQGTGFNRGVLYLNIGARAHMRNEAEEETNEGYIIEKIAPDPDYPGEIVRIEAFGRGQTFRGVTGIVANGGSGYDYIEIGPGITSPVTLTGGDKRDWLMYRGSGNATFNGGDDDDEMLGGFGTNTFVMADGFGRDKITSLSTRNHFD
ncbi:MAG: hypothetical protein ACK5YC_00320, partial [Planctomyces sp.]